MLFLAVWVGFLLGLFEFSYGGIGGKPGEICGPHLQACESLRLLSAYPFSYSQMVLNAGLFALLLLSFIFQQQKRWLEAHLTLLPVFFWRIGLFTIFSFELPANFEYFSLFLAAMLLLPKQKLYFCQIGFAFLYFLSASVKFNEGWINASYFTSLELGMAFVPDAIAPIFSNLVIGLEIFVTWWLLSQDQRKRNIAVALYVVFHLYSILIVGVRYPVYTLFPLVILFYLASPAVPRRLRGWDYLGYAPIMIMLVLQLLPYTWGKDKRYTQEGYKLGLGMFDANHQCRSLLRYNYQDGTSREEKQESRQGMNRCMPYVVWWEIQKSCRNSKLKSVEWKFDHSINGEPFYRVVDEANACDLKYKAWGSNDWIHEPNLDSIPVGYPERNHAWGRDPKISNPIVHTEPRQQKTWLQAQLLPYIPTLQIFWLLTWIFVALFQFGRILRANLRN